MPYTIDRQNKANVPSFHQLYRPIQRAIDRNASVGGARIQTLENDF